MAANDKKQEISILVVTDDHIWISWAKLTYSAVKLNIISGLAIGDTLNNRRIYICVFLDI